MALPRAMRFRDRRALQHILKIGYRLATPLGKAVCIPPPRGAGRILFVISKAVAKKSPQRHRIKRQLDSWVLREGKPALHHRDIVVFVSPAAATEPPRDLRRRARATLDQISSVPFAAGRAEGREKTPGPT